MFGRTPRPTDDTTTIVETPHAPTRRDRTAAIAARTTRAAKIGLAVGVAVLAAPFDARALDDDTWQWWADDATAPATTGAAGEEDTTARPDEPLLDACPIDGSSTFEDSWGWARSGGRRHEGVDMIASRGTPVVAVRDGVVEFSRNNLGGRAVWLLTDDGDKFYYAHLDAWHGEARTVTAGELIGYVGSSGNAKGPHLHFETLPDGNVENPFPHTLGACVPPPEPVVNTIAERNSSSQIAERARPEGPSSIATRVLRGEAATSAPPAP